MIRDMVSQMLKRLGHLVETAEDGEHALRAFCQAQDEGTPFDAVIGPDYSWWDGGQGGCGKNAGD